MTRPLAVVWLIVGVLLPTTWGSALPAVGGNANNLGIFGGQAIPIDNAPYMAALFDECGFDFLCGGTIVHEKFILTAAHCMIGHDDVSEVKVLVGADNLEDKAGISMAVENKFCYTGYNTYNDTDDICLLKLKEEIQFRDKIAKITLPDEDFMLEEGTEVNVTGWGTKDDYVDEKQLRQVTVPIQSQDCCRKIYEELTDDMICAGSKGRDACWGDSGGPLTYFDVQIGIVSYGEGCGIFFGVYTRVSSYINWINSTITENL